MPSNEMINTAEEGSGTSLSGVSVTDAKSEVKTSGLSGLPVMSMLNSESAPVGSEVVNGTPELSVRKNENSSGIAPRALFVERFNVKEMVPP